MHSVPVTRLSISGMHCAGCATSIEGAQSDDRRSGNGAFFGYRGDERKPTALFAHGGAGCLSTWAVNGVGTAVIGLIVGWFWLTKPKTFVVRGGALVDVLVENGVYTPARIEAVAGRPITLRFLRRDSSPCAEQVRFDDLGVTAELPVGKPRDVTVTPSAAGEYEFTCQMRMYRGILIAR